MTGDHARRLLLAWSFLLAGIFVLCAAYVPSRWSSQPAFGVFGVATLALVALLGRTKTVRDLLRRAPSGKVGAIKPIFLVVSLLSIFPAVFGLAEIIQQQPLGSQPRLLPNAMLAVFGPYALVIAYGLLAASGRGSKAR